MRDTGFGVVLRMLMRMVLIGRGVNTPHHTHTHTHMEGEGYRSRSLGLGMLLMFLLDGR